MFISIYKDVYFLTGSRAKILISIREQLTIEIFTHFLSRRFGHIGKETSYSLDSRMSQCFCSHLQYFNVGF